MSEPWPHQVRAVREVLRAIDAGCKRVCLVCPTGGGKTRMACELIGVWLSGRLRVSLYSNRRMLIEQTSRVLDAAGLGHGVRAAGHEDRRWEDVQVSSVQTEASRVFKRATWELHPADRVVVDEAHLNANPTARKLIEAHVQSGAAVVGLTATPIDLGSTYDQLVVAGVTSELRDCGALVRARHYGCDEPDLRRFKNLREGEDLTEQQNRKAMMTPSLWGRVLGWFVRLNPDRRPSILFAPGVPESLWFAERFSAAGIRAAHIDGEDVWLDGRLLKSSRQLREDVLGMSKDGSVKVLCNRFVLREGIDCPWLAHGVFACVFGSLQSYLQSGGRLLRAFPGLGEVTVQDHGGNWWRHGSLNADREWHLGMTAAMAYGLRADRLRNKAETGEREPWACPECGRVMMGRHCACGYAGGKRSRRVVDSDGNLHEMEGDCFRPRRVMARKDGPALWEEMYHRSKTRRGARTFRAAAALFAAENGWRWPDPSWPLMPTDPLDHYRLVSDVPRERLTPKE